MKQLAFTLFLISFIFPSAEAAQSVTVKIQAAGTPLEGTLVLPDKAPAAALPLVVVVHEWWGKTDYPLTRARQIADILGYATLAVDLFGTTTGKPDEAQKLVKPFYETPQLGIDRLHQFIAAAPEAAKKASANLDLTRIAAIGYCFGGGQVLNLARAGDLPNGEKLRGVVSFHGSLASPLKAKQPITAKMLVLHGGADPMVKPEEVAAFKSEMKTSGARLKFLTYPGAKHAFTNPQSTETGKRFNLPIAYNAAADKKSWHEMKTFLAELFKEK